MNEANFKNVIFAAPKEIDKKIHITKDLKESFKHFDDFMKTGRQENAPIDFPNKNYNNNKIPEKINENDSVEEIGPVGVTKNHVEKKFKNIQSVIKERSSMKSLFSNVKRFFI